jgi:hypothetical protein
LLDRMPAPHTPPENAKGEERAKAAVGGEQSAANWRPKDDEEDETPGNSESGRGDLNPRPSAPKTDALPG